jgi:chemosensory pili system protein ChpA (sensor histidine kinase/response regulator)
MLNEIFRAAHSVKGGAAMLGLHSIQQTAHRLEDSFKDLKECPTLRVDQKLESLFLRVFDNLKELLDQLESEFCLREDVANKLMSEVEPVFEALNQHLKLLVKQAGGSTQPVEISTPRSSEFAACAASVPQDSVASAEKTVFQSQVLQQLRQMLQLFKQPETPQSRQQLQECCQQLVRLGEQFNLRGWCTLCETTSGAIAKNNTYRTLAPIVIKELKQAQELILAGRGAEIRTSEQLQALSAR